MFELLTFTIFIIGCAGIAWACLVARDTLHPLIFICPIAMYFYAINPYFFEIDGLLSSVLLTDQMVYTQILNLSGLTFLILGCIQGSGKLRLTAGIFSKNVSRLDEIQQDRLFKGAMILAVISLGTYAYNLGNVGGFVDAYSHAKGGGTAGSGYLRDFVLLSVPATTLFFMARLGRPWFWHHYLVVIIMAAPNLIHGLFSARRGPTFVGITSLLVGWFYSRETRPRMIIVVIGCTLGALLLFTLVTYRGDIYIGSSLFEDETPGISAVLEDVQKRQFERIYGNEFIYGTIVVDRARIEKDHFWGRRWLTILFIRPIPSQIWPTKYRDVGMESMLFNAGTLGMDLGPVARNPLIIRGNAPGIIADSYVEFSWGAVVVLYLIGYIYGRMWRNAVTRRGFWIIVYTTFIAYSAYLVSQSMGAMLVRLLVTLVPAWLVWKVAISKSLDSVGRQQHMRRDGIFHLRPR